MPWFMVDDEMSFHPKTLAAGNEAMGMWVRAGSWCQKQMNGGIVPDQIVVALGGRELADSLVAAGLWTKSRTGFRFHQWDERQLSKEEYENRRKAKIEAGRKGGVRSGESRRQSKNEARAEASASTPEKPSASRSASFSASDSGQAKTADTSKNEAQLKQLLNQTGSPVPDPFPKGVNLGGGSHVSSTPPPPGNLDINNPRCPDHLGIPATDRGPNCRACGHVRQWVESEPDRRREQIREDARRSKALIANCPECDEAGWVKDLEPVVRCKHERRETA